MVIRKMLGKNETLSELNTINYSMDRLLLRLAHWGQVTEGQADCE